jgi:hypothetical protein
MFPGPVIINTYYKKNDGATEDGNRHEITVEGLHGSFSKANQDADDGKLPRKHHLLKLGIRLDVLTGSQNKIPQKPLHYHRQSFHSAKVERVWHPIRSTAAMILFMQGFDRLYPVLREE